MKELAVAVYDFTCQITVVKYEKCDGKEDHYLWQIWSGGRFDKDDKCFDSPHAAYCDALDVLELRVVGE